MAENLSSEQLSRITTTSLLHALFNVANRNRLKSRAKVTRYFISVN